MTKTRRANRLLAILCLGTLALAGAACEEKKVIYRSPIYAVDMKGGAKSCTVSQADMTGGKSAEAMMTVGNDGGWCGISVVQAKDKPFAAGLVQARPAHGQLEVHTVGDATRVDYTPDPGHAGVDSFTVRMLPGNSLLKVTVRVTPG